MPKFKLIAEVVVSAFTIVEADTLEDAIEAAKDRAVEIGGINAGVSERDVWVIEESDGLSQKIRAN